MIIFLVVKNAVPVARWWHRGEMGNPFAVESIQRSTGVFPGKAGKGGLGFVPASLPIECQCFVIFTQFPYQGFRHFADTAEQFVQGDAPPVRRNRGYALHSGESRQ